MTINLVIFDLDGVLVDACEWHRVALNNALKEVCNYEISLEDHHSEFNGIPTKVKLNKLLSKGFVRLEDFGKIEELKQQKTLELIEAEACVRNEKVEMIEYLKSRGLKVACYTNSIRMTAELMLKKTGILSLFDMLVTNQDVKLAKPSPEGYNNCMKAFCVSPENCLIVEDSPKGIEAATKSGARVLVVHGPDEVNKDLFLRKVADL